MGEGGQKMSKLRDVIYGRPHIYGGASILSTRKCLYESVETVPFGGSSGDGPPRRESRSRSLNPE
jgi:hypothetical protein